MGEGGRREKGKTRREMGEGRTEERGRRHEGGGSGLGCRREREEGGGTSAKGGILPAKSWKEGGRARWVDEELERGHRERKRRVGEN